LNRRLKDVKIKVEPTDAPVIDLEELTIKEKMSTLKEQKAKSDQYYEQREIDKKTWKENGLSNLEGSYEVLSSEDYKDYDNVKHIVVKLNIMEEDKKEYRQ